MEVWIYFSFIIASLLLSYFNSILLVRSGKTPLKNIWINSFTITIIIMTTAILWWSNVETNWISQRSGVIYYICSTFLIGFSHYAYLSKVTAK
ncbi:hypothetical protein IMZ31_11360 [Pontibacillus sp. ALD_SL1]|uniref:hypothetical protein n=1 Tax=Pontibacillus sp. ALD_SL1 TaxID=2777185 RepID=UPI001A96ED42|nr:hypothetical protein [Pontibacillus sp. ALD_SL1]QSS98704.1 hypothetical protein IMZ31_11360 [Pontibacillus sp. ALD_SL1]